MRKTDPKDWIWDGGRPSIDLLNTLRDRKLVPRELLVEPSDLAEWLVTAGLVQAPPEVTARHVTRARALREAIDRLALAVPDGPIDAADVAMLNDAAKVRASAPELAVGKNGRLEVRAPRESDPVAVALGRIAADAVDLVTSEGATFRVCASDTCGLRFEDRSPARNRQWCSMKRCGNREKARQHYLRQK
ncbi:CGNR zinc finger domain-containing protein [Pendulispora albinea]|uniref:ABATE domain-containing protein n=1 Tax=Pendulispora albinea TaxID=2741071 RepID=A0ABZ2LYI1_9BACT